MTWVKLQSSFWGDERVLACPPQAVMLYLAAMGWCADQRTDGHVSTRHLGAISALCQCYHATKSCRTLVEIGLWEETPDGWYAPDYPQWGPMADTASYQAERNREKQRRRREKEAGNPVTDPVTNPVTNGSVPRLLTGLEESRREEKEIPPVVPHGGTPQKPPRKSQIPEDFEPDSNQRRWAAEERPGVDLRDEVPKFVDYHRSKGNTFVDHQRAFRVWMRRTRAVTGTQAPKGTSYVAANGVTIHMAPGVR